MFLPDPDDCYERLRRTEAGATVSCVYCGESDPVIKKGTTGKGAQQYRCKECETYFNDLTDSLFEHRKFSIEEMFYMIKEMQSVPTAQIASELQGDYEAVLNFRHDLQELCDELDDLTLSDVCEANEIYVTAGEKGIEKEGESPRERGQKKRRGSFESDKPPVVTLVRRSDGRVEFLVRENLQEVDEEVAARGDETVILCTDDYTIYDDIEERRN